MSVFNVAFRSDVFLNIQVNTDYVCLLDVFCAVFFITAVEKRETK